ncbi:MAG: hypothetical protein OEW79_09125 [Betaproteobacteria bacterium]|nr:hypothetical protein [Betaproteobacteria bacterium]MDH5342978.1 hypothetical protein [Betaproteobacteria bacterium]
MSPQSQAAQTISRNMKLVSHNELAGFGGIGEGINMQVAKDGRRILWLAHESAPKNFTGVDVTDPKNPKVVVQTDLPHEGVRSNSLDVVGDIMAVAYQTKKVGDKPAGMDLFDISTPEKPKLISHFDASGPHSRGAHCVWFVDGEYVHLTSGSGDFEPTHPNDFQFYRIIDVRNPSKPKEVGRWHYPGTHKGDKEAPPPRHPRFDGGYRPHNINVYPERPDRAYMAYLDGGAVILDISDKANPKMVTNWKYSPPFNGFCHTVMPLFGRDLLIVTDECTKDDGIDWPKLGFVVNASVETNLVPVSTLPLPPVESFAKRGGRYGAHNLHENLPGPASFRSNTLVVGTFFNGGVRAFDTSNPYQPQEVGYFVPGAPKLSPKGAVQINDVWVDEKGLVYAVDRFGGGLYVIEMTV